MNDDTRKVVLNAGCGATHTGGHLVGFAKDQWREVRLDVDPHTNPDIVGSFADMRGIVADAQFDAIYSSHAIEHLHAHEVIPALREFLRVLKPDGFAVLTCPDLAAIARQLLQVGSEGVVYNSPAGPIRPIDMLFGHSESIGAGRTWMAHHTGFTAPRLARVALASGFKEARIMETEFFDLWAVALGPQASAELIAPQFAGTALAKLFASSAVREEAPAPGAGNAAEAEAVGGESHASG